MLVFVLNKHGKPLMPCSPRKARILLKEKKAKVVKKIPFTIQLLYGSSGYRQPVNLGVDAGSKHIGISATTEKSVLFEADIQLRDDVVDNLSTRRELRRSRRQRKTRYRKPRFDNKVHSKKKGWLAPSIRQKIETHLTAVDKVCAILPIKDIIVECASFDIQKIKNPEISGKEYQEGEQLGSWNVREYVLCRDNHTCQCCHGKSGDKILNTHHIESRKVGGDAPNNLITLCETCHNDYHNGKIQLPPHIKRGTKFKDTTFMGIMRWTFFNKLKEKYQNVHMTFGYITKNTRIKSKLPKDHYIDARCISGNPLAKSDEILYLMKKVRRHRRQHFDTKPIKGGKFRSRRCAYEIKGFRCFDLVRFEGRLCYIAGLRTNGYMELRDITDETFKTARTYKKLQLIQKRSGFIVSIKQV